MKYLLLVLVFVVGSRGALAQSVYCIPDFREWRAGQYFTVSKAVWREDSLIVVARKHKTYVVEKQVLEYFRKGWVLEQQRFRWVILEYDAGHKDIACRARIEWLVYGVDILPNPVIYPFNL